MKIKIFSGNNHKLLEEEVNKFIDGKIIHGMQYMPTQSQSESVRMLSLTHNILVQYEEVINEEEKNRYPFVG